jgi:predicted MFS family arabinose efflux permease
VLVGLTASMLVSLVLIAGAPNFVVLMAARALLGVSIGGFWSLSTATVMRLVPAASVAAALAMLYTGNAIATTFAAPIGSYLGGVIGWRGVFWAMVPLVLVNLAWQWMSIPAIAPAGSRSPAKIFALLGRPRVAFAMLAVTLTFAGAFSTFTYFRPFLESYTRADVPHLSALFLALGLAGFAGTYAASALLRRNHLYRMLTLLPVALGVVTLVLLQAGHSLYGTAAALFAWGALNAAIPVAWSTWLTEGLRDDPEGGGGLMVAAIQLAIMLGGALGGLLLDHVSIEATFVGGAILLFMSAAVVGSGVRLRSHPVLEESR